MYSSDAIQDKVDFKSKRMPIMGASQVALVVQNPPANAGDTRDSGLIPGLGRSPGGVHGNPLQYSCLENPMDRIAWWATVHRVEKNLTRLKRFNMQMWEGTRAGTRHMWHVFF